MKSTRLLIVTIVCLAVLALAAPVAQAGEVVQGVCLSYDPQSKTMTVKNELDPAGLKRLNQKEIYVFDLSIAKIGASPEKGNIVRVAFQKIQDKNVALKVMNVSKQDIRAK
ncbi:MAG: hypothetical protein AB1641_11770 [Thermodesulfobacteriota bacterium]